MRRVSDEEKRDTVARQISRARNFNRAPRMRPGFGEAIGSRCASVLIAAP